MITNCTHCKTALDVSNEHYGQTVQCPSCNGKLQISEPPKKDSRSKAYGRDGWLETDHANVSFVRSLIIGTIVAVVILAGMIPFRDMKLGGIFLERGWVNYAETFLFSWGVTILVLKFLKNKQQEKAALISLFPESLGPEINSNTVGQFIDNVYSTSPKLRDSIFVNRIRKALELFEIRNSNNETSEFLTVQSDLDAN